MSAEAVAGKIEAVPTAMLVDVCGVVEAAGVKSYVCAAYDWRKDRLFLVPEAELPPDALALVSDEKVAKRGLSLLDGPVTFVCSVVVEPGGPRVTEWQGEADDE